MRIKSNSARFSSLKTWDNKRIEVNQILGSDGLGFNSPLAIANIRLRIFSCEAIPILIIFQEVQNPMATFILLEVMIGVVDSLRVHYGYYMI